MQKMGMYMEDDQVCAITNTNPTPSSLLNMHKASQTISKTKPKIRIIHIFAPEVIKTDAANFRELVQRLTGKPTVDEMNCSNKRKRPRISSKKLLDCRDLPSLSNKKMKVGSSVIIKGEEEDIWNKGTNSEGGFLSGFADFDGLFMQELNQFPFLEGTTTTQMDAYVESQLIAD